MRFRILPMTEADIDAAVSVQKEAFTPDLCEDPHVFRNRIERFGHYYRMAYLDGRAVGYVICFPWKLGDSPVNNQVFPEELPEADCFFLHDIALLPEARGTGLAQALINEVYNVADGLGFDAVSLVAVKQSGSFWDKMGFVPYAAITPEKHQRVREIYGAGARLMARPI